MSETIRRRRSIRFILVMHALLALGSTFIFLTSVRSVEAAQSNKKKGAKKQELSQKGRERVREALVAVGQILVRNNAQPEGKGPSRRGSAVLVRRDGILATCYHVIADEMSGKVFDEIFFDLPDAASPESPRSRRYRAAPVLASKELDLALLALKSDGAGNVVSAFTFFPVIELADSRKVKLLDALVIIGFPASGLAGVTVNTGIVEGVDSLGNWIKTDARVIHGNSGGAAVSNEGKLIGIPTKVLVDKRVIDEDGDGFPDGEREYGAVGFLRPSHFVATMLAQLDPPEALRKKMAQSPGKGGSNQSPDRAMKITTPKAAPEAPPKVAATDSQVSVRGTVKSAQSDRPVAGARVGLVRLGVTEVSADSLVAWGSANTDGDFELNKPVPPGQYTLKVRALGYEPYSLDIEIKQNSQPIVIKLRPSS